MKRNKLKRQKGAKQADQLLPGCCSEGETWKESLAAPPIGEGGRAPSTGSKIAPIFSPTNLQRGGKGSCEGGSDPTENKPLPQKVKSHHSGSHLTGKHEAAVPCRRRRARLPSSHLDLHLTGKHEAAVPCRRRRARLPSSHLDLHLTGKHEAAVPCRRRRARLPSSHLDLHLTGKHEAAVPCRRRRARLPSSHLDLLLEEIQQSNPGFPVPTVFQSLLKKTSDELQDPASAGVRLEEDLWTNKYFPQHSSEVIGNSASVTKLHSWLQKWKLRAEGEEQRMEEGNDFWDCGAFQGDGVGKEPLAKAMLLTGPSGVGKTAAVYACAQQLGFKVFEVNCSSQRSGRHVLAQLKEATQSHLVDIPGDHPLKPAYFNNFNTDRSAPKPEASAGKVKLPKSIRGAARSASGRKVKAKPSAVTLACFFKAKREAGQTRKPKMEEAGRSAAPSGRPAAAMSLILFEEVDVVFEADVGFLAAIKAFLTTTKRPVVLTTADRSFRQSFHGYLDQIVFKSPSALNVCSFLQLVCLAENVRLPLDEASSLVRVSGGDVRRCLLQLQLWVNGGRGRTPQHGDVDRSSPAGGGSPAEGGGLDPAVPPQLAGCSAHMLGLHPLTPTVLLNFLQLESCSETFLSILSESWRRNQPLLYSNLELLLSMAAPPSRPQVQMELRPPEADLHLNHTIRSTESPSCFRPSRLSRRRRAASSPAAKPASDSTYRPQRAPTLGETRSEARSSWEQRAAEALMGALESLADFYDLMSNIDALLSPSASQPPAAAAFLWTGAALKDGMTDEPREEGGRRKPEALQEIQAAAEGLGGRRCWRRLAEAWSEAHGWRANLSGEQWGGLQDRLLLSNRPKQRNLCFTAQPPPGGSSVSQRLAVARSALSLLGNRRAVCIDYLPLLRRSGRLRGEQWSAGSA
ncbi:ATPase family AAA domain-containing protein 5-like isoform X2 [Cyprinodon tularosa]|uniref:ATPase family AAA domain-containing protein 5-like isoform X2 n=1 Tax=Cyprinodon tularosa TaxID=77115 RepID=UPI0018E28892|nr:ATPase family AAA domain-containing protein 5-like isoform X2 [Cyprinodon tularosa]